MTAGLAVFLLLQHPPTPPQKKKKNIAQTWPPHMLQHYTPFSELKAPHFQLQVDISLSNHRRETNKSPCLSFKQTHISAFTILLDFCRSRNMNLLQQTFLTMYIWIFLSGCTLITRSSQCIPPDMLPPSGRTSVGLQGDILANEGLKFASIHTNNWQILL